MAEAGGGHADDRPDGERSPDSTRWMWRIFIVIVVLGIGYCVRYGIRYYQYYMELKNQAATAPPVKPRSTTVFVQDSQGGPVKGGATVELWAEGGERPLLTATTAFNGGIEITLPPEVPGWNGLYIRTYLGPLVAKKAFTAHPGVACGLILPASVSLQGRVVVEGTGEPRADCTVSCGKVTVPTDAEGRFRLGVFPKSASPRDPIVFIIKQASGKESRVTLETPWPDGEKVFKVGE